MSVPIHTFADFRRRYPIRPADPATWLGSGSYGRVVKVEDQVETEWVAVKISEYKGEDTQSLRAEVELAQRIPRHANIARYDSCYRLETDASVSDFAVMKYYQDGNLAKLLKRGPLTPQQVYDLTRGILLGLQHLHQQRIVHRDFKPANILISRDNQGRLVPKIADFGLSKRVNDDAPDRSDFDLSDGRGTPSYKAPEQIEGGRVSYNLDLWAFGVVLYEMLLGEKPFGADRANDSEQAVRRSVERRIIEARLPAKVEQVAEPYRTMIKRCLVRDLYRRVRRADELLALLDQPSGPGQVEQRESPSVAPLASDEPTDVFVDEKTDLFGQTELTDLLTDVAPTELLADAPATERSNAIPPVYPVAARDVPKRPNRARRAWRVLVPVAVIGGAIGLYFAQSSPPRPTGGRTRQTGNSTRGGAEPMAVLTSLASTSVSSETSKTIEQLLQQTRTAFYREQYPQAVRLAEKGLTQAPQRQEFIKLKSLALDRLTAPTNASVALTRVRPAPASPVRSQSVVAAEPEPVLAAQQQYNQLIEQGTNAISNGNDKVKAISLYGEARQLADKFKLNTERGHERYLFYLGRGDRIFDRDSPNQALHWYRVAQAIENTGDINDKIRKCAQLQ